MDLKSNFKAMSVIGGIALALLLTSCDDTPKQTEGLTIVPLYGKEKIDISDDVRWSFTKVGIIRNEQRDANGRIVGFSWEEKLDSYDNNHIYSFAEGEIGVDLSLGQASHYSKYKISSENGTSQKIEVNITDIPRIKVNAEGLGDDDRVELSIYSSKMGSYTEYLSWAQVKDKFQYIPVVGKIRVTLTKEEGRASQSQEVVLGHGQTGEVNLKFSK